jgi:hypothetical protein
MRQFMTVHKCYVCMLYGSCAVVIWIYLHGWQVLCTKMCHLEGDDRIQFGVLTKKEGTEISIWNGKGTEEGMWSMKLWNCSHWINTGELTLQQTVTVPVQNSYTIGTASVRYLSISNIYIQHEKYMRYNDMENYRKDLNTQFPTSQH